MRNEFHDELTRQIDQRLRQLPDLQAPTTLLPRVLATLEARAQLPWWRCSWAAWPLPIRIFFFGLSLSVVSTTGYFAFHLGGDLSANLLLTQLASAFSFLTPVWNVIVALANAFVLVMRSGGQLFLWGLIAVATMVYLTCVALGTVCYRVALNKI